MTILNCAFFAVSLRVHQLMPLPPDSFLATLQIAGTVVCALPLAIFCLLPSFGHPSGPELVTLAVMIGLNSLVWGYGLSWIIRLLGGSREL